MKNVRLNTKLISSLNSVLNMRSAELIVTSNIKNSTYYRIMQTPIVITIQQLLALSNSLHIPVRRFFSTEKTDVIGLRDDYIVESYLPCYYDGEALQQLVSNRSDATWRKAAKATGMSYYRLKNSVIGETRTPVTRFLTVCEAFGIDPFTILIDPNPELKIKTRRTNGSDQLRDEINGLREDIRNLHATVADLRSKYEALLAEHSAMDRRIKANTVNIESIGTINGGHVGIAAET